MILEQTFKNYLETREWVHNAFFEDDHLGQWIMRSELMKLFTFAVSFKSTWTLIVWNWKKM